MTQKLQIWKTNKIFFTGDLWYSILKLCPRNTAISVLNSNGNVFLNHFAFKNLFLISNILKKIFIRNLFLYFFPFFKTNSFHPIARHTLRILFLTPIIHTASKTKYFHELPDLQCFLWLFSKLVSNISHEIISKFAGIVAS